MDDDDAPDIPHNHLLPHHAPQSVRFRQTHAASEQGASGKAKPTAQAASQHLRFDGWDLGHSNSWY